MEYAGFNPGIGASAVWLSTTSLTILWKIALKTDLLKNVICVKRSSKWRNVIIQNRVYVTTNQPNLPFDQMDDQLVKWIGPLFLIFV